MDWWSDNFGALRVDIGWGNVRYSSWRASKGLDFWGQFHHILGIHSWRICIRCIRIKKCSTTCLWVFRRSHTTIHPASGRLSPTNRTNSLKTGLACRVAKTSILLLFSGAIHVRWVTINNFFGAWKVSSLVVSKGVAVWSAWTADTATNRMISWLAFRIV